jgi:hypothetical protein
MLWLAWFICRCGGARERQAAELTKNASRQRTETKLENMRFMLLLNEMVSSGNHTPCGQFSRTTRMP